MPYVGVEKANGPNGDRHAVLTTMQLRLNRGQGDETELQFYKNTIQQLPLEEQGRHKGEVPPWTISPFDVELSVVIGTGG